MARGNSNQASLLYKYLPCIFFLVLVNGKDFYVVPSESYPCRADHCLTLSQFVSIFTNCSNCDNATVIFASGEHNLESGLIVEDIHSFSMFAEHFSSAPQIICHHDAALELRNISTVTIDGVVFIECTGHQVVSVVRFHLTNTIFYNDPEIDGTTLSIVESSTHLDRVAFLSTNDSSPDHTNTSLQQNCALDSATVHCVRVLINTSTVVISQSLFDKSIVGVGTVVSSLDSETTIFNSTFRNNRATHCSAVTYSCMGAILSVSQGIARIYDSVFEFNEGLVATSIGGIASFTQCIFSNNSRLYKDVDIVGMVSVHNSNLTIDYSTFISNTAETIHAYDCNVSISNSDFIGNGRCLGGRGGQTSISHSTFLGNNGDFLIGISDVAVISIYHNEFVDNSMLNLIGFSTEKVTVKFNEFTGNEVDFSLVGTKYYISPVTITNNEFINNSAVYDVFINSDCAPGLSTSFGSSRCIECPEHWYLNLAGLVIAAFVAGIVLVVLMLALNFTVAIGTLNGILFYANIVASNTEAYFPLSSTPNLVSVIVSWLNLDIGFDICFFSGMTVISKALVQLAFPAYIISLVIIIIIISECSSKFARTVGKGDPVAVLATMILISYTKCLEAVIESVYLLYLQPAYGSLNFYSANFVTLAKSHVKYLDIDKALFVISPIIFLLGLFYTALVFSWQWLIQHQDKKIFKWVRYQKLQHFIQPYHAPYASNYCYWTGLLLIVRITLFCVSAVNFSRDPRVDFVSTIFVIGCLILFKGVIVKRIYKNVVIDVMETAIYFNLVFFAAFSWYCLDFGGNQVAVAYISVMIVFALLLAVVIFHVLRFTSLHKFSILQRSYQWITTKLVKKKTTQREAFVDEDEPDEIDGVLQQRSRLPHVSYSAIKMSQNEA